MWKKGCGDEGGRVKGSAYVHAHDFEPLLLSYL